MLHHIFTRHRLTPSRATAAPLYCMPDRLHHCDRNTHRPCTLPAGSKTSPAWGSPPCGTNPMTWCPLAGSSVRSASPSRDQSNPSPAIDSSYIMWSLHRCYRYITLSVPNTNITCCSSVLRSLICFSRLPFFTNALCSHACKSAT